MQVHVTFLSKDTPVYVEPIHTQDVVICTDQYTHQIKCELPSYIICVTGCCTGISNSEAPRDKIYAHIKCGQNILRNGIEHVKVYSKVSIKMNEYLATRVTV